MEEIIKMQLNRLYTQREKLVEGLGYANPNEPNYLTVQNELRTSIDKIDMEVQNAMFKLENFAIQQLNKV